MRRKANRKEKMMISATMSTIFSNDQSILWRDENAKKQIKLELSFSCFTGQSVAHCSSLRVSCVVDWWWWVSVCEMCGGRKLGADSTGLSQLVILALNLMVFFTSKKWKSRYQRTTNVQIIDTCIQEIDN